MCASWRVASVAEFEVSRELIRKAMQHEGVQAHLAVVAQRIAARAQSMAASEGVPLQVSVQTGIRPQGRPFANVVGNNVAQEFGDANTPRARIMGRAAAAEAGAKPKTPLTILRDASGGDG